jgi:hypothetical protein
MADINQIYEINILYVFIIYIVYSYIGSNYNILSLLQMLNYEWLLILIINIIGLYLLLKNMTFEIKLGCSIGRK